MGATKKICELKFFVENFWKSYFINYQKYSKDEPTEIFEVIILQNLPKINNVYILNSYLNHQKYRIKPDQIYNSQINPPDPACV